MDILKATNNCIVEKQPGSLLIRVTRIMISKGMVSKGQYSNFGPGKGFEYSF